VKKNWKLAMSKTLQTVQVPKLGTVRDPRDWHSQQVTLLTLISLGFREAQAEALANDYKGTPLERLEAIFLILPEEAA